MQDYSGTAVMPVFINFFLYSIQLSNRKFCENITRLTSGEIMYFRIVWRF